MDINIPKGFRLLAEWEEQGFALMAWPHEATDWNYMLPEVQHCFIDIISAICRYEELLLLAPDAAAVRLLLSSHLSSDIMTRITFLDCPTNDTWTRDSAFLTLSNGKEQRLLDFRFNGWGGKFEAQYDNAINSRIYDNGLLDGEYIDCLDFELEGGSIETDGRGTLLTTTHCLLNANRGEHRSKSEVEGYLKKHLGVEKILWLHHGLLEGDDTDGHIDTLARMCPNGVIAYVKCDNRNDAHYEELKAMEDELREMRDMSGVPFQLLPLPMADPIYDESGERLPATYANYFIINKAILMPTYNQPENDARALSAISKAFPCHEVVGIDCSALIRQHGSLHCSTMQFYSPMKK